MSFKWEERRKNDKVEGKLEIEKWITKKEKREIGKGEEVKVGKNIKEEEKEEDVRKYSDKKIK